MLPKLKPAPLSVVEQPQDQPDQLAVSLDEPVLKEPPPTTLVQQQPQATQQQPQETQPQQLEPKTEQEVEFRASVSFADQILQGNIKPLSVDTGAPSQESIIEGIRQTSLPPVLTDIGSEYGDALIYAPEIIATKVPTVYNTLDPTSTRDLIKQGYAGINDAAARRFAERQAATEQAQRILEKRDSLPNVPRVDRPWNARPAEHSNNPWLDILFGKEEVRNSTRFSPNLDPRKASYGQAGSGLLGGLNYIIGLPLNFLAGLGAEIEDLKRRWDEKALLKLAESNPGAAMATAAFIRGKSKTPFVNRNFITTDKGIVANTPNKEAIEYAQRYIRELFKPQKRTNAIIGYDETKASQRNLLIEALRGAQLGDTNDPKETNKGVFFSPRRPRNVRGAPATTPIKAARPVQQFVNDVFAVAKADPLGTGIELFTQLFLDPWNWALSAPVGTAIKRLAQAARRTTTSNTAQAAKAALTVQRASKATQQVVNRASSVLPPPPAAARQATKAAQQAASATGTASAQATRAAAQATGAAGQAASASAQQATRVAGSLPLNEATQVAQQAAQAAAQSAQGAAQAAAVAMAASRSSSPSAARSAARSARQAAEAAQQAAEVARRAAQAAGEPISELLTPKVGGRSASQVASSAAEAAAYYAKLAEEAAAALQQKLTGRTASQLPGSAPRVPLPAGPDSPKLPGAPESPQLMGRQPAPALEGAADAPQLTGKADSPQLPGAPPSPALEGAPDLPRLGGTPPAPALEGTQELPQLAGKAPSPALEGAAELPQLTGKAPAPALEGAPEAPALTGVPEAPALEGAPDLPVLRGTPESPQLPGVSPAPALRGTPPAPALEGAAEAPTRPLLEGSAEPPKLMGKAQAPALEGAAEAPKLQGAAEPLALPEGFAPPAVVSVETEAPIKLTREALKAEPTRAKFGLQNANEVMTQYLQPVGKPKTKLPRNSPAEVALRVGVGKPSPNKIEVPANLVLKGIDDAPGGVRGAATKTLLDAAEQLAANKAVVNAQLAALDELFTLAVDFGRKPLDRAAYELLTPATIKRVLQTGGRLNLPPKAFRSLSKRIRDLLEIGDYDAIAAVDELVRSGSFDAIANSISAANNSVLSRFPRVAQEDKLALKSLNIEKTNKFLIDLPKTLYHGTAISEWSPNYNLDLFATRGELGSGLYFMDKSKSAELYAKALVTDNVAPETLRKTINPAVYAVQHKLETTLNARAELTKDLVASIVQALPPNLRNPLLRKETQSFSELLDALEEQIVKQNLDTSEEGLRRISNAISSGLRRTGFDSVFDPQSGFIMALDESSLKTSKVKPVEPPTSAMEAIVARYNADAFAAYHFPERLSADANLRDSTAKLLNQLNESIDLRLREVQQELIRRGAQPRDSVLPPMPERTTMPTTVEEALRKFAARSTSPCQP
jgi:hypothetical protein